MTATAVQDTLDVRLNAVADDESLPIKGDTREAIRVAINKAARKHHGRVTSADFREFYPPWHVPEQVGPTIRRLKLRGYLIPISRSARYGSGSNSDKAAPVYRVTAVIPKEAVQP